MPTDAVSEEPTKFKAQKVIRTSTGSDES